MEYIHIEKSILKSIRFMVILIYHHHLFYLRTGKSIYIAYVDPGCVSPEEGIRSVPFSIDSQKYSTIKEDLEQLTVNEDLSKAIFLFHAPPYETNSIVRHWMAK